MVIQRTLRKLNLTSGMGDEIKYQKKEFSGENWRKSIVSDQDSVLDNCPFLKQI